MLVPRQSVETRVVPMRIFYNVALRRASAKRPNRWENLSEFEGIYSVKVFLSLCAQDKQSILQIRKFFSTRCALTAGLRRLTPPKPGQVLLSLSTHEGGAYPGPLPEASAKVTSPPPLLLDQFHTTGKSK